LQQVVFHSHYDNDSSDKGNPRTGWTYILTVRDLSRVLHSPLPEAADSLLDVWNNNWEGLNDKPENLDRIMGEIDVMRKETLSLLDALE